MQDFWHPTGLDAAAKLDVDAYDVVVLDRDLPGIHGDTLCQMITERDSRVMVLMLTAADSPSDRVSGLTLGADDYLAKPFHFRCHGDHQPPAPQAWRPAGHRHHTRRGVSDHRPRCPTRLSS